MSILCTFPGKAGDVIWALPTVRALSRTYDTPVDLVLSPAYGSLKELIERQDYIGTVLVDEAWQVQDTAPMTPRIPPQPERYAADYAEIFHLGYPAWPRPNLPQDIYDRAATTYRFSGIVIPQIEQLDLQTPWIAAPYTLPATDLVVGFTDEHFELKYGLYMLLHEHVRMRHSRQLVNVSTSPRWRTEGAQCGYDWMGAAAWIGASKVFVGCCSALHVLAVAMGTPVIVVEPNPHRHGDVFYPLGKAGRVQLLLGNDGQPTIDSRHLGDAIEAAWAKTAAVEPVIS